MPSDSELRRQIDRPLTTLAVAFLSTVASVQLYVAPILVGAAVSGRGFSEKQVGDAFGLAGLVYVLVVGSSPLWIARWDWRWLSGFAVVFSTASAVGLALTSGYSIYILLLSVQTGCLALLFPPIMCALGASSEPEKKYGTVLVVQSLTCAVLLFFLKALVLPRWDYEGVYSILAVCTLLGLAVVGFIPARGNFDRPESSRESGWLKREWLPLLGLMGLALFCVTMNGFTSFSERYGEQAGISGSIIASALALGVVLSAAGAAMVAVVGNRWGRVRPMMAAMAIAVVAYGVLLLETDLTYFAAVCVLNVNFRVIIVFSYATVAAADTTGRFTGTVTAAAGLGIAVSATMMGRIIVSYGYSAFVLALMIITPLSVLLMAFVAYQVQQRETAQVERGSL